MPHCWSFGAILIIFASHASARGSSQKKKLPPPASLRSQSQTSMSYPVSVQWQMLRSRAHSSLAGTTTESYAVEWTVTPRGTYAVVVTPHERFELPWVSSPKDPRAGTIQLTRFEVARLLGVEQELPQDGRLWQAEGLATFVIQSVGGRASETIFRHVDDNGMVLVRLSARVASKP